MDNTAILEKLVQGSLMEFTDETIRLYGAAAFEHPFGNYGKDLIPLTKGLERKSYVTYRIYREPYGTNHVMEWDVGERQRRLEYFIKDGG